jgi:hypothetical protein
MTRLKKKFASPKVFLSRCIVCLQACAKAGLVMPVVSKYTFGVR